MFQLMHFEQSAQSHWDVSVSDTMYAHVKAVLPTISAISFYQLFGLHPF